MSERSQTERAGQGASSGNDKEPILPSPYDETVNLQRGSAHCNARTHAGEPMDLLRMTDTRLSDLPIPFFIGKKWL